MTTAHEADQGADHLLSPVQARKRAGVSHRTFQRYRAAGLIKPAHVLPNGHARFRAADVDALLAVDKPADAAEAGHASPLLLVAAVLAALLIGWTTPPGTGLALLGLSVAVGVGILHVLGAHVRGMARVESARHRGVTR